MNQDSFTPLVFTVAGVMRDEDRASYSLWKMELKTLKWDLGYDW